MQKKYVYGIPLAVVALAAGIWFARTLYAPQAPETSAVAALWQVGFPDMQGRPQPLAQWRGRTVVLNFWASWCAPCREEIPDFVDLRSRYQPKGVEFVGIAIDNQANVAQFLQRVPVNYPILIGEGAAQNLSRRLGNTPGALPYTVVLDRDGRVVLRHLGRLPRATLEDTLRKLDS
ncbi:MAG: TlpA disulfide reductase family protein [Betaproteobacteria bacterium]|nr:TlpA disulfide reductase family protein [Betaproteobacteria bacterium]